MNSLLNEGRVFDVSEIQDNPYVKKILILRIGEAETLNFGTIRLCPMN